MFLRVTDSVRHERRDGASIHLFSHAFFVFKGVTPFVFSNLKKEVRGKRPSGEGEI